MKKINGQAGSILWCLVMSLLMACSTVQATALVPIESPKDTSITSKVEISTSVPLPTASPTVDPILFTPTFFPEVVSPAPTLSPPSTVSLRSIRMLDLQKGWAIADLGAQRRSHVLRTTNGGATWRDVSPVDDGKFESFFLDDQSAWLWDSDSAWRTQDGGLTWASLTGFGWLPDVWFNDPQHGWKLNAEYWGLSFVQFDIVSFATTEDGGQTWQEIPQPSDNAVVLFMAYPTDQVAWAVSAGFAKTIEGNPNLAVPFSIQATLDGGKIWTTRQVPLPPGTSRTEGMYIAGYLDGVGNCDFVSPAYSSTTIWKLALTCESQSWMYTTTDQGNTWIISPMPAGIDVRIQFVDPSNGWLFLGGWSYDFQGNLYRTTDGGQSWTLIKRTGWGDVQLSFVDDQTGWGVACSQGYCYEDNTEKALLMTRDGGATWEELEPQIVP